MKQYLVVPFYSGCISGGLNEKKLTATLNEHAAQGWRFAYSIHETRRIWFFFTRETHFIVLEREQAVSARVA